MTDDLLVHCSCLAVSACDIDGSTLPIFDLPHNLYAVVPDNVLFFVGQILLNKGSAESSLLSCLV